MYPSKKKDQKAADMIGSLKQSTFPKVESPIEKVIMASTGGYTNLSLNKLMITDHQATYDGLHEAQSVDILLAYYLEDTLKNGR